MGDNNPSALLFDRIATEPDLLDELTERALTTDDDKRTFAINATETMFPYLRAAVTNLTADALINPLTLPVVSGATIFPDDRGPDKYTLSFDPKVIN